MFNVKSLAVLVALGVLSVTASQSNGGQEQISVYACKDPWWGGQCRTFYGGRNECVNFSGSWNDVISSIRHSGKGWHCQWWEHANCQGLVYQNQDDANLSDGNGRFDNRISSFRCG
ncbi:hypothetical protein QC761_511295 [Podospora bellae-mahoneyi]|uniref:Beta/gamma crystallin 'Greek key' domain-containing protein n=1 Tax=Podospora bellae-mahoneyi TaxID=2093777 RepID=A0ABR0FF74_9PEZI|nr:hypothetical protein QC761_511295 [Podospora bellae-mahoneyi]